MLANCSEKTLTINANKYLQIFSKAKSLIILHIPNEGKRSMQYGASLKKQGMIPGAPDFVCVGKKRTIFIELKTEKGRLSDAQKRFQEACNDKEIPFIVCRSIEDVIHTVETYYGQES
jgi:hypothetical protein